MSIPVEIDIDKILKFIGVTHDNVRHDAYNHWYKFADFITKNNGKSWKDYIRPRLRSYIGIDFRFIDDYLECFLAWKIIDIKNGNLFFIGINGESETQEPDTVESEVDKINKLRKDKEEKQQVQPKTEKDSIEKNYDVVLNSYINEHNYQNKNDDELANIIKKEKFNSTLKRVMLKQIGIKFFNEFVNEQEQKEKQEAKGEK